MPEMCLSEESLTSHSTRNMSFQGRESLQAIYCAGTDNQTTQITHKKHKITNHDKQTGNN